VSDLFVDFETYSAVDIKKRGGMNYATHPSTQIVCMGYAFDKEPVSVFTPADELHPDIIEHVLSGQPVYAHNATFDYRIWNFIGHEQLCWPRLSLGQVIDSMALCQTFGVPASLHNAGEALGISMPKSADGLKLIKLCCVPTKSGVQPTPWGVNGVHFGRLYEYCKRDIEAMREIVYTLPRKVLIPKEQRLWELTYEMNTTGLPIDYKAIVAIRDYLGTYVLKALECVPEKSGGAFKTLGQLEKIKAWCGENGFPMDTLDAAAVQAGLDDPSCPENVREVLEMRQELGRSSTAKFTKLAAQARKVGDQYWVHDNVQFHGAGPGRWAGRGFQVHNLPRASVPNPEERIQEFLEAVI